MVIRGANKADVIHLCGSQHTQSMRALVVEHDGEPVAIAGVLHTEPMQCFSVMTDVVRQSPKTIVKTAIRLRDILNSYHYPIFAVANMNEKDSDRFLTFVGFNHFESTITHEVYQWPQQSPG